MKKLHLLLGAIILVCVVVLGIYASRNAPDTTPVSATASAEKVYVALEGDGAVAVIDGTQNKIIKTISLTDERTGTRYMPHNVQAALDGSIVWVTANARSAMEHQSTRFVPVAYAHEEHEDNETMSDQVIAINPINDAIVRRIPIGINQHLAHVVQSSTGSIVLIAAQESDKIYVLDSRTMAVGRSFDLPKGSGPHGIRLSPDNATLYAAFMSGKTLAIIDVASGKVESVPLDGAAMQTAVTPDGSYVAVSVYDSKSVGVFETRAKSLSYVRLPQESQGPVQLYPTADSRSLYVADQGVLNGRSASNKVYKIDLESLSVSGAIEAGSAPHGIVLNEDNTRAYVTNLKGDSVSVIDVKAAKELVEIKVGREPNGISVWNGVFAKTSAQELIGAKMTVYKSATCGCCGNYVAELRRRGAQVTVEEISDEALSGKKQKFGVPPELQSCHTVLMDDYVIEGHVPIEAVVKLRSEHPTIKGIALPGMPAGSPGMSGIKAALFTVQTLDGGSFGNF